MNRIIVFLKYPEPGRVKTRLAAAVGDRAAARLARHFAEQTLLAAKGLGLPLTICFAPAEREADFRAWLEPLLESKADYAPQQGADLGARMAGAFSQAFAAGAQRVVLVGTDAPDRPAEFLAEALELLAERDAVLGPALDGGYHLIAFCREGYAPEAFRGIEWSSPRVLAQTLDALKAAGRGVDVLPPWRDIDDAAAMAEYLEDHPEAATLLADTPEADA